MSNNLIPRVRLFPIGMAFLFRRNPWVPAWWSAVLPGFGHIVLGANLKGLLLMAWEILVNNQAHLNLAIYHTVLGEFEQARSALDYRWAILYPVFYIFAMVDSYRLCVEYNRFAELERLQKRRVFDRVNVTVLGIKGVDKRNPAMATFWSAVMPGLGHLYCNRIVKSLILMGWYLAVVLQSGLGMAAFHSILGRWEQAVQGLDYQWLLFWPSIYVFAIVDAYADAAEQNVIAEMGFRWRMRRYLRNGGAGPLL